MNSVEEYDYIVVGAGSAGSAVASRLSEDPSVSVLVLEAGPPSEAMEISMPAGFATLFRTRWDWNYQTVPQAGLGGKSSYWPRMKATGGCSAMNAMIYIRGAAADFDGWRRDFGAVGWGYDDVLPYFKRAEDNTRLAGRYHGADGPLHVEDRRYTHPLTDAWIESAAHSGFTRNDDFNGATQYGVGRYQVTCHKGKRWSTAEAYLKPATMRANLTLLTEVLVTKLVVDEGRVTAVRYLSEGREHVVRASAEVVLCGGAINSPQLLMLSGIGPAEHLAEIGIETLVDLPGVGANLHDHPVVPVLWDTRNTTDLGVDFVNPRRLVQWQALGRGPLSSNVGEGGGFMDTRQGLEGPDMQFHIAPTGFYDNGFNEPTVRRFTAAATLVDVASRGNLRLSGTDPRWRPLLDPAYYRESVDREVTRAGIRALFDIAKVGPLSEFLLQPFGRDSDECDDAALDEVINVFTQTLYHPVGTCAMGTHDEAVVDPKLRVRGVLGLRVADASVMPRITRGNTNAASIMIGEKCADLLRGRAAVSSESRVLTQAVAR